MNNKLVSVCINVYNAEKFICETIQSVIDQTYKNLQIIIVDDCSTDNTYDIVNQINDDRIELYKTPFNGHMSFACNEALKYVKGEYVAHLDADDLWLPDKIEKQVAFLESNPEYGACFTHVKVNADSHAIEDGRADYFKNVFASNNMSNSEMYRFFYDHLNPLCHSSVLMRTTAVKKVGGYDTSLLYLQDFDYWMRLITFYPIYVITEPLTVYTVHSENNSNMGSAQYEAHDTESAKVFYRSICMCPDDLFLSAFKDLLFLKGEHTHEETEIEKALLLSKGTYAFPRNPILGIYKFSELFNDEKYIRIATEKFKFTTRELYKLYQTPSYHNYIRNDQFMALHNELLANHNELQTINDQLSVSNNELINCTTNLQNELHIKNDKINALDFEVNSLKIHIDNQTSHIDEIHNLLELEKQRANDYKKSFEEIQESFFWKITSPFRFIIGKIKNILH